MRATPSLLLIFILLFCASCFEIVEDISLNADGSGSFRVILNASESEANLRNYIKLDNVEGVRIPSQPEIEQNMLKLKFTLQRIHGLSNIQLSKDWDKFIFKISGDFENIEQLNRGINQVADVFNTSNKEIIKEDNFKYAEGSFKRLFNYPIPEGLYNRGGKTAQFILDTARMSSILRFAKLIKSSTNKKAIISPSGKAVMLKATLAELVNSDKSLYNEISLNE